LKSKSAKRIGEFWHQYPS